MDPAAFRTAWREWKFCTADQRLLVAGTNDLICPACSDGCAGVHVDANMKLFTWERAREVWRRAYFDHFFMCDDTIKQERDATDAVNGQQVCGRDRPQIWVWIVCGGCWGLD